jgi:short-subunit dehydrogenase
VHVLTVRPGFVDTQILKNSPRRFGVISPELLAAAIWKAIKGGEQLLYVPWWWRWIMLIVRNVPSFIFRRLSF